MTDPGLAIRRDGQALHLTFDRADSLNSLTEQVLGDAAAEVQKAGADPDVRVIVLAGTGRAFSSGASLSGQGEPDELIKTLDTANALVEAIVAAPKPVLAAVNGLAAGVGATVALACDLVVARRSAYFLLAFVNIGLMPDGGATALVPAAAGRARAARMAMLGEKITADMAFDWGLISHVVDDADFDTEVGALVDKLRGSATLAIAKTKQALAGASLSLLRQAHSAERAGQLELFETADFAEGVRAFTEKRASNFEGR